MCEEKIKNITEDLKVFGIEFNADKFDQERLHESLGRIQHLINLLKMPNIEDCDVTRDAYSMLRKMGRDDKLQHLLADDQVYFSKLELMSDEKINLGLKAALAGATKVAEALFDQDFNPKENADIVPYAVASGKPEWVKSLVEKYQVNIQDPMYLFRLQAQRFSVDLLEFYKTYRAQPDPEPPVSPKVESRAQSEAAFAVFKAIFLANLEALICDLEESVTKKLLLYVLLDCKEMTLEERMAYAEQLIPGQGGRFGLICCAMDENYWTEKLMSDYKNSLIAILVKASQEQADEASFMRCAKNTLLQSLKFKKIQRVKLNDDESKKHQTILDDLKELALDQGGLSRDAQLVRLEVEAALKINSLRREDELKLRLESAVVTPFKDVSVLGLGERDEKNLSHQSS